jgi:hypothetical protein
MKASFMTVSGKRGRPIMRTIKIISTALALMFAVGFLLCKTTDAKDSNEQISGSFSGSSVTTGFDFDNDSSTDQSGDLIAAGKQNGGGAFTLRLVNELDLVPGTGCGAFPAEGCNIDGVNDGCLFTVVGGAGAFRFDASGDISTLQITGGTACINPNSASGVLPPFDSTYTQNWSFKGGSGKFAGTTGSGVVTGKGQITSLDQPGHSFSWDDGTYTGTISTP